MDYLSEHSHSHTGWIFLTARPLLAFCFLFVCMVDQTQLCHSSISLLGLSQEIIYNIQRLIGGPWSPELLGDLNWRGVWLKGGTSQNSSYHVHYITFVNQFVLQFIKLPTYLSQSFLFLLIIILVFIWLFAFFLFLIFFTFLQLLTMKLK